MDVAPPRDDLGLEAKSGRGDPLRDLAAGLRADRVHPSLLDPAVGLFFAQSGRQGETDGYSFASPVRRRAVRGKFKHIGRPTGWKNMEGRPWRGWIGLACRCQRWQFG